MKFLSSFLLALLAVLTASASDSALIFNEVHYHPANEAAETEWIEFRSLQGVDVDISGWRIEGGISYTFPTPTVATGGAYILVARVPGQLPGALGPWTGQLSNGGEEIRLVNRSGRIMDVLAYGDNGVWPVAADGSGATLARRDGTRAETEPSGWAASNEIGGTPGATNFLDPSAQARPTIPVPVTASWKYDVSGVAPASNWNTAAFDDGAWPSGPGLLYAGTAKLADPEPPGLLGWWAFQETSGTVAANSAPAGVPGLLVGADVAFVADVAPRSRVLRVNINTGGTNTATSFVNAGKLPAMTMTNDFTWAFWAKTTEGVTNDVMVGNRSKPGGGDFSPVEFIKFTNSQLEWHRNGGGENLDYADPAMGTWIHHALVKTGASLTYYRNGVSTLSRAITAAPINEQPFFFGADGNNNNTASEAWSGYLDDVAIWPRALTAQAIAGLASNTYTPATVPPAGTSSAGIPPLPAAIVFPIESTTPVTDDFSAAALNAATWAAIDRGLESSSNGNYATPSTAGGQLTLGGTTSVNLWAGKSIESVQRFSTRETINFSVTRVSLGGSGTGRRSSIWLYGDADHYLHFAQSPGENGWQYHSKDTGGSGTNQATGAGVNLGPLDSADADLSACVMQLVFRPGTYAGEGTIEIFRNGVSAGIQAVSNWPAQISVVLTGEARQAGDSVSAVFDNAAVTRSAPRTLATNVGSVPSTAYFRRAFNFGGDPATATLSLWPLGDDGAVYFLNGQEIHRHNMPAGVSTHGAPASSEVLNAFYPRQPVPIATTHLIQGMNMLAVQVHQASPNGGDLLFGAQLNATEAPAPPADTVPALVFNEFAAATDATWRLELANLSGVTMDLSNFAIRTSAGVAKTLTGTMAPGALLVLDEAQLGFRPADGDALFLVNASAGLVTDSRSVTNRLRARSPGGAWLRASTATFGTANTFAVNDAIVISEIMYNAPFEDPEQWVELYNRGAAAVDLSSWSFSEGISFVFPAGTILNPGEYALVVWDVPAFNAKYQGKPRVFGPFGSSLSGRGERLTLLDANQNVADEVNYRTDGRWPRFADGGGSSLELRDLHGDNSVPEAWAASDELPRSTWTNVSYDFSGANLSGNPAFYSELILGMVAAGEALVDDLQVIEDPNGTPLSLLANGDFSSGTSASWRFLGNHARSTVVDDPAAPGNKVLKIVGDGYTEHMSNHCETTLRNGATLPWPININKNYRISYRARWIGGSNRLHSRLYFNRGAHQELLPMPSIHGTPGAANSRAVANAGPVFQNLRHSPAVPPAGQPATVSIKVSDPDVVSGVTLFYSVNGAGFAPVSMTQSAGTFSANVPAQAASAKVQFYVQATDNLGAISTFPAAGSESRAIIPWADGQERLVLPSGARPHNLRLVLTAADTNRLHALTNVMSNEFIPCTIIYDERDIYYHCGVHLKSSEHGRAKDSRVGFRIQFSPDELFLGKHEEISIDRSGTGDQFSQKEILVKRTMNRAGGIPVSEDDLCRVIAPRPAQTGPAILNKTKIDSDNFLDSYFDSGADGTVFEYERTYTLNSNDIATSTDNGTWEGLKLTQDSPGPPGVNIGKLSPGISKEEYRWFYLIKNNRNTDNYAPLITALTALGQGTGGTFHADTAASLDIDGWLRSFSGPVCWGIGDNYISNAQHNALFYARPDGRVLYIPWDMDFTANQSFNTTVNQNTELNKLNTLAANKRAYYGHLLDVCNQAFNTTYLTPWAQHYTKFLNEDLTTHMTYVSQREAWIRSEVASGIPVTAFAISTNSGNNFSVAANSTTLTGTGWIDIRELRRIDTGLVLQTTWSGTPPTTWQVTVALNPGANPITIGAYDHNGILIGSDTITITNTLNPPQPRDHLRVTEVHYNPADPSTPAEQAASADNDDFEFIELINTASTSLNISGCHFDVGVDFIFPGSTNLAAGERIMVVRNVNAFRARYGIGPRVAGAYGPDDALSNSGEILTLRDGTGAEIESFPFGEGAPWPNSPDGNGYSLTRSNPAVDAGLASNWRSSTAVNGTPGGTDGTVFTGDPNADDNGDGINNLLQYALAGTQPAALPVATIENGYVFFRYRRNLAADDVTFFVEQSLGLGNWSSGPADAIFVSETHHGDGTATQTWRGTNPVVPQDAGEFFRLRVSK